MRTPRTIRHVAAWLGLAMALTTGCGLERSVDAPADRASAPADTASASAQLDDFLAATVDRSGGILVDRVRERQEQLERLTEAFGHTGPNTTPQKFATRQARIAYSYNARTIWSIRLAAAADFPRELSPSQLERRPIYVDGQVTSLADIDDRLATFGWKVLAGSPGVRLSRAPLPQRSFRAEALAQRIDRRLERFVDDPDRLVIQVRRQRIVVPHVLWSQRDAIISQYVRRFGGREVTLATALLPHVGGSPHRRLQNAMGYEIRPGRVDAPLAFPSTD